MPRMYATKLPMGLQVVALAEYRAQLFDYLRSRMSAIAPNLTVGLSKSTACVAVLCCAHAVVSVFVE